MGSAVCTWHGGVNSCLPASQRVFYLAQTAALLHCPLLHSPPPAAPCSLQGSEGLSFGKPEAKLGWNAQPTTAVMFDGVRVPEGSRIGQEGDGFKIAMSALDGGRINIGACRCGGHHTHRAGRPAGCQCTTCLHAR